MIYEVEDNKQDDQESSVNYHQDKPMRLDNPVESNARIVENNSQYADSNYDSRMADSNFLK